MVFVPALMVGAALFLTGWDGVSAYQNYYDPADPDEGGNCKTCHPQFDQRGDLHDMHVGNGLFTSNCNNCHKSNGDNPIMNEGLLAGFFFSCTGCHGNDYGKRNGTNIVMEGHNLRWRHVKQQGVTVCLDCHDLDTEPFPESVIPFAYTDTNAQVNITDGCNADGTEDGDESWKIPDPAPETEGLDNDGDGIYDMADPDCIRGGPARIVNVNLVPGSPDTVVWTASPDASDYQVLRGTLDDLLLNRDFGAAICADSGTSTNSYPEPAALAPGEGFYFLVRGLDAAAAGGTYDSDGPGQQGNRDTTATACP
jgi:hypothetical protein